MKKFGAHTMAVFSDMDTNYDEMNNLMQDLALGREIYDDENDRVISKAEANKKVLDFSYKILGITDPRDTKEVRRAMRDNSREWFDIIEDTVSMEIDTGLKESDWFNELVERKTIGYGDRQDFVIERPDAILSVAKAGEQHNDHFLQRLRKGETISVPTSLWAVKVGADINKYILGDVDWAKFVNAIAIAFINQIQTQVYAEVGTAISQLPTRFKGTGTLVKADFDKIIQDVAAYNSSEVVIMGTKAALSKISAIADVQWAPAEQKVSVMNSGNIGIYEGTRLVTIPTRFKDYNLGTTSQPSDFIFPTNEILIMPVIGDAGKFVKMIDEGNVEIIEKMEKGDYLSDLQTYQAQRRYGIATVLGRYFGSWIM